MLQAQRGSLPRTKPDGGLNPPLGDATELAEVKPRGMFSLAGELRSTVRFVDSLTIRSLTPQPAPR
jgi:hypothetical protein